MHITAVLVKYKTSTGRVNKGVATTYLKQKHPDGSDVMVPVFIRKSQFRLPTRSEIPVIMVGPGTGLAPFRGFIQERQYLRDDGKTVGDTILYFGCRKKEEDFIYREVIKNILFINISVTHKISVYLGESMYSLNLQRYRCIKLTFSFVLRNQFLVF